MWSVTPTTNWIIVFGGVGAARVPLSDTRVLELSEYLQLIILITHYIVLLHVHAYTNECTCVHMTHTHTTHSHIYACMHTP